MGISIAREQQRGRQAVYDSMLELREYLGLDIAIKKEDILFDDGFFGNGYEAVYPQLLDTIEKAARNHGIILDPTYTGKAFHGMLQYFNTGRIPQKAKVLFWHTGGLLNLLASETFR